MINNYITNKITVQVKYKEEYEATVKGKGATMTDKPYMDVIQAKEATKIASDVSYKL